MRPTTTLCLFHFGYGLPVGHHHNHQNHSNHDPQTTAASIEDVLAEFGTQTTDTQGKGILQGQGQGHIIKLSFERKCSNIVVD